MKWLVHLALIAATVAAPSAVFAQSYQPLTRDQVIGKMVQFEKAGFNPARSDPNEYPDNAQTAEARVAAQSSAAAGMPTASSKEEHAAQ